MISKLKETGYAISTDLKALQLDIIHGFLTESYWSKGIPKKIVEKGIQNSMCFGVYFKTEQVGFARLITDYTSFAYLADVFILEKHRGQGLSKWLMHYIVNHPQLKTLRRWMLATNDAHGLYRTFGFKELKNPQIFMELHFPDIYKSMKD